MMSTDLNPSSSNINEISATSRVDHTKTDTCIPFHTLFVTGHLEGYKDVTENQLSWGLETSQPLWVILSSPREREKREEIIEEMKERDRGERKMNESEETRNKNIPPLPLPVARIARLA